MWRGGRVGVVLGLTVSCGSARYGVSETGAPSMTLPAHFAEGEPQDAGVAGRRAASRAPGAPAGTAPGSSPGGTPVAASGRAASAPDPVPLTTANQWEFSLQYSKGTVRVVGVREVVLERPMPTARRVGRFAIELHVGSELVDRVRFDFPLLAADAAPDGLRHPLHGPVRFAPGAETSQRVLVPGSDRATSALVLDRLTGDRVPLAWPPVAIPVRGAADGGRGS
jgi:hypothetical protein